MKIYTYNWNTACKLRSVHVVYRILTVTTDNEYQVGHPEKRSSNGVLLADRLWPAFICQIDLTNDSFHEKSVFITVNPLYNDTVCSKISS